jgi:hypothetical protein
MGVLDDVLCNNDLFGDHKGETHFTQSLHSVFPGSKYEITPMGRLELLECTFEDRSDPNAPRWLRLVGMMTPVFTGRRSDVALHGWVEFPGFGRASSLMGVSWLLNWNWINRSNGSSLRRLESRAARLRPWKARSMWPATDLRNTCGASFTN